jgi:signal peptidase II
LYWIIILTLGIDQLFKYLVRNFMDYGQSIPIINGFIQLTSHRNTGAAWGIFSGQKIFLISIAIIVIVVGLIFSRRVTDKLTRIAFGLFIGGAMGNVVDRLIFGEVTDMFEVTFINYPIFNTADVFLVSGVILFLISTYKESKLESNQSKRIFIVFVFYIYGYKGTKEGGSIEKITYVYSSCCFISRYWYCCFCTFKQHS